MLISSGNILTFWVCVLLWKLISEISSPGPISCLPQWISSSPSTVEDTEYMETFWVWSQLICNKWCFPAWAPSFLSHGLWCRYRWRSRRSLSGVTWVFTEALVMLSRWPVPGLLCVNCAWVNTFVKCFSIPTEMSGGARFCGLDQCPPDSCPQPYPVSALDQWCPVHPRPSFCSWILRSSINQLV